MTKIIVNIELRGTGKTTQCVNHFLKSPNDSLLFSLNKTRKEDIILCFPEIKKNYEKIKPLTVLDFNISLKRIKNLIIDDYWEHKYKKSLFHTINNYGHHLEKIIIYTSIKDLDIDLVKKLKNNTIEPKTKKEKEYYFSFLTHKNAQINYYHLTI